MNLTKRIIDTLTWSASTDQELDLPTEGIITRIDLEISMTAGAAIAAELSTVGLWRVLNTLRIQGGGGHTYFNMSGVQMGILLHYMNLLDFPGTTWREIVATTQAFGLRLHFGSRPRDAWGRDNPFDLTAGIPAEDEPNLRLIWGCPAANVIDNAQSISSATMYATVHYVLGASKAGLMVPISFSEGAVPGTTYADLTYELDVPTGAHLRRVAVMAQDHQDQSANAPLLMADQVTELGIKLVKDSRRLIEVRAKTDELEQPWFDGMEVVDTPNTDSPWTVPGLYCLDLRKHEHRDYGMNLMPPIKTGDVKLAMTIGAYTANDVEYVWYDELVPYSSL